MPERRWILWGVELSPFALKLEALLRIADLAFVWMPQSGPFREAFRHARRRDLLVRRRVPLTWPPMTALDEFPQVPFLFGPDGETLYDSSAIGAYLVEQAHGVSQRTAALLPAADPALRFAVRLIDEALDEVGLYLVHHQRWVVAARDNDAGARLARDMRPLLGPAARVLRLAFPRRQVRRLPYLFSVAPADDAFDDLPVALRPPTRPGFPPTHALLATMLDELLAALEPVLARRPFLFGDLPTLADASVYGQLDMNRSDPSAWRVIVGRAPETARWIERMARGELGSSATPDLQLRDDLAPLLGWVARTFVPLMRQNAAAWVFQRDAGETRFNEAAFDAGRALYDGELLGQPFRSVVKTFQVRVWQTLRDEWDALDAGERSRLAALMPVDGLDG
ncbi:MAG TPA: glutathione S-transferase C-terminal domain-containing protein [Candidatus Binatia bacterium]|jgi:glutathione S-transferase|nr:glutathione S-transferase C-terminal domain-containing protein [Candidatus Binatia bacterium]